MAIRVSGIKQALDKDLTDLHRAAARKLGVGQDEVCDLKVLRRSVDARKKDQVCFVYTVEVSLRHGEARILARLAKDSQVAAVMPAMPEEPLSQGHAPAPLSGDSVGWRPIVVGAGPAGLFAALTLAWHGCPPLVLEQGHNVAERTADVENFWATGNLKPCSNVQFGEGGAGTFSDGKLTTRINDQRIDLVLNTMVEAGAPEEIRWLHKPHVGTDRLKTVVANLRQMLTDAGAEVRFGTKVTGIVLEQGRVAGVEVRGEDGSPANSHGSANPEFIPAGAVILAPGHSSRDTYRMLHRRGIELEAKPLAIGARIEHRQEQIDKAQYGRFAGHPKLGAADYQLTYQDRELGRSAYTFCMCPGGSVVGAASGPEQAVTNGMSDYARDTAFANSAVVVSVSPDDYPGGHPLSGVEFLEKWEREAYELGGGNFQAPATSVGDFLAGHQPSDLPEGMGTYRPGLNPADLHRCLPGDVAEMLEKAIIDMGRRLHGFDTESALLTGVETRTSAPVRILRGQDFQAVGLEGLFPAGEGAGYAGGIMSAAVDGIRAAEALLGATKL